MQSLSIKVLWDEYNTYKWLTNKIDVNKLTKHYNLPLKCTKKQIFARMCEKSESSVLNVAENLASRSPLLSNLAKASLQKMIIC